MKYGFGVDVGGTTVKLGLFREDGTLLEKQEIPTRTEQEGKNILPDIAAAVKMLLEKHGISKEETLGIGIGVPGPVDEDGNVNRCVNLGWGVFNLHAALGALTDLPVKAGNDANVAALGEYYDGGGKGSRSMIMVTIGTGIGGGYVMDGKVLNGAHGVAGEIGHITIDRNETEYCTCGKRGCAEQYASARGMVKLAKRYLAETDQLSLLRAYDDFTSKELFQLAQCGDRAAQEILERVYDILGETVADACCLFDPELVVLGGGVSKAGRPLLDGVHRHFVNYMFHACKNTGFALAQLGNDAGIYGSFHLLSEP